MKKYSVVLSLTTYGVEKLFIIFMRKGHITTAGHSLISNINQLRNTHNRGKKVLFICMFNGCSREMSTMKRLFYGQTENGFCTVR